MIKLITIILFLIFSFAFNNLFSKDCNVLINKYTIKNCNRNMKINPNDSNVLNKLTLDTLLKSNNLVTILKCINSLNNNLFLIDSYDSNDSLLNSIRNNNLHYYVNKFILIWENNKTVNNIYYYYYYPKSKVKFNRSNLKFKIYIKFDNNNYLAIKRNYNGKIKIYIKKFKRNYFKRAYTKKRFEKSINRKKRNNYPS